MSKSDLTWSVPVMVDDIAETGLHVDIEAPADARAGIANVAGLRGLPHLSAVFDLVQQGPRVQVSGRVTATVAQTCVVTLEPMENAIEEAVDITFAPQGTQMSGKGTDEPPELLIDGVIDLGAVATEFLLLGIDPYPRKAGAQFVSPPAGEDGPHPFAALEKLKKRSESEQ